MISPVRIAEAEQHHFPAIRAVELAAFETLRHAGAVSGEAEASDDEELGRYQQHGILIAAFADDNHLVGYAGALLAEGFLHIGEMDVHPDWQRRGIGRQLMETLLSIGGDRQLAGATLTTDRLAPFNAPFYQSLGFRSIERARCPMRLAKILDAEIARGFDPDRRIAMILPF